MWNQDLQRDGSRYFDDSIDMVRREFSSPAINQSNYRIPRFQVMNSSANQRDNQLSPERQSDEQPFLEESKDQGLPFLCKSQNFASDFASFYLNEELADVKLRVRKGTALDNSLLANDDESQCVEIPAHKVILAARSPYFKAKFCRGDWSDGNKQVACLLEFSERQMKDFLKYLYTGSLKIDISNIMGAMKISSYFMLDELTAACKNFIQNGGLNAFDLCILYCEVREDAYDFDDMKSFLCGIIPSKIDTEIICRVLKEIWQDSPEPTKIEHQTLAVVDEEEEKSNKEDQDNSLIEKEEEQALPQVSPSEQDLQEVLFQKLQLWLPEILSEEKSKADFFQLPEEVLRRVYESSYTCLSEMELFKLLDEKICELEQKHPNLNRHTQKVGLEEFEKEELEGKKKMQFFTEMLKLLRLPHISIKNLVKEIKFSTFFNEESIFEAIQFKVTKDVLSQRDLDSCLRFQYRGVDLNFKFKNEDIEVGSLASDQLNGGSKKYIFKRKTYNEKEDSYVSCIAGDPLPLHGIHYFELKIRSQNNSQLKQVFMGLCSMNDNEQLKDSHLTKSAILLNCYDSSFWNNGQQIQVFSNKFVKIKQPLDANDTIRFAIDLRLAKHFSAFWKEAQNEQLRISAGSLNSTPQRPNSNRSTQAQTIRERLREQLRFRNIRGPSGDTNFNLFLNSNNEIMFFNHSPCKMHFAFNSSEFHEGVDLNLMNLKESPLHLVMSLMEVGLEVEMSRVVYFDDWELIPKEPFLLAPVKH